MAGQRIDWGPVIDAAVDIVYSYATGVTLRQLHYQLVSRPELGYRNTQSCYKQLSSRTVEMRRNDEFPDLVDRGREIHRRAVWASPSHAVDSLIHQYRLDRTAGQEYAVYVGVEKNGLVNQLTSWFDDRGLPVVALGGYSSQTYVKDIQDDVASDGRPAVLLYAGDFDPSGVDIQRDFESRSWCFDKVIRVALNVEQIDEFNLPPMPGKASDSRAGGFIDAYGSLMQVEVDALDPDTLRSLYEAALVEFWDESEYESVCEMEVEHLAALRATVGGVA